MKIEILLTEEMLGTASSNPELHREFIASKSPDAATVDDEVAAIGVDGVVEKQMTVFPRNDGHPFLYDYQVKGFFKDTCSALSRVPDTKSSKLRAFRKVIDGIVFVSPRRIFLNLPEGLGVGNCQRPLRAQTPQGERVALANSETVPAGTKFVCEIVCLDRGLESVVKEWLDYGKYRGLGQWRNSGKGRFTWCLID